jgi:hypothetical protein
METFPPEFVHPTVTEITVGKAELDVQSEYAEPSK